MGSSALEYTVTVFLIGPTLFVSYLTSMLPEAPGAIGPSGFFGTVHPQLDFTFVTTNSASPVLVNSNTRTPSLPFTILP